MYNNRVDKARYPARFHAYLTTVDVLAYVAWRISGFPKNRVLGLGTMVDSSRFCNAISKKLGLSPDAIGGYLLGEQGDKAGKATKIS
ncbi:L-lactate dehydrogenase [Clonorchis sinensis]|uniref:L-lactate dehydrogenase n=1 Tax=Clonorchis sinensis TaxID=79923 RepID=G7Y4B7_CLOSI|nr:L-lactate dehydrogenase [Clonorchis sinensis]